MKTRLTLWLLAAMLTASAGVWADETITVSAQSEDISQNLDLKAVATVFGQSADLEQFERSLNDYENRINNLDLNGDGEVDYLRVVETGEGDKRLVVIQAVLAQDIYQDVASIMVEKDRTSGQTVVQIVGDEYIYGTNYIIEPVYLHVPVIYDYFWRPYYSYWVSPYYWGYWPSYWTSFTCWAVADYWWHINAFHRHHHFCSYRYAPQRRRGFEDLNRHVARHDLATRQPEHGFSQRNQGMQNSRDIVPNRTITNRTLASGGNAGAYQQNTGRVVRSQSEFNASRGNSTATRYNTGSRSGASTTGSRGTSTSYSTGSRSGASTTGSRGTSTSYSTGSRSGVATTGSRGTSTSYNAGTRSSAGTSTSYSSGTRGTSTSYNAGTRGTSSSFSGSRSSAGSSSSYSSGSRGMSGGYSSGSYSSGSRSSVGSGYSGGGRSSGGGFSGGGSHSSGGGSHGGGGTGRR